MKELARRVRAFAEEQGRSRLLRAVLVVVCALALLRGTEWGMGWLQSRNWRGTAESVAAEQLTAAAEIFNGIQRHVRGIAEEAAKSKEIGEALADSGAGRGKLFDEIARISQKHLVGAEVFDARGTLVAWSGKSGPRPEIQIRAALEGRIRSVVHRTPGDLQLVVVAPIPAGAGSGGAVLLRQVLETSAPFTSRYLAGAGLTERAEEMLGTAVEFSFSSAPRPIDGRYVAAPLLGVDSARVGSVSIMRPGPTEILERTEGGFKRFEQVLVLVLAALFGAWIWRTFPHPIPRLLLLWGGRYLLLLLDFPLGSVQLPLFEPTPFASKFGGGLARSIGDLTLTVLAAGMSTNIVVRSLLQPRREAAGGNGGDIFRSLLVGIPLAVLLFWSLRGYAAVIRSAVFDSSIELLDPGTVLPTVEVSLMLVNLVALGFCFLLLSIALTIRAGRLEGKVRLANPAVWIFALLFGAAALLFGILGRNPLMDLDYRFLFGAGVLMFALWGARDQGSFLRPGSAIFGAALAGTVLLLFPLLHGFVREHDRDRIETMAQGVVRPVDRWFTLVVEDGLRSFQSEDVLDVIREGDETRISRLAFTRWLRSPAAREGYTSIFTYFDASGYVRSRFAIGGQLAGALLVDTSNYIDNVREVNVSQIGRGAGALKVYQGLTDIVLPAGGLVGFGQVTIAAGQQTLFRGETPMALRAGTGGSLQSFYRQTFLAEFSGGKVQPYAPGAFPRGARLPPDVVDSLSRVEGGVWRRGELGGEEYVTLYLRRPGTEEQVVAVSLVRGGVAGRMVGIVMIVIHAAALGILLLLLAALPGLLRRERPPSSFRARLLAGMIFTAILPLIVLTIYGKAYTTARIMEESRRTLQDQTQTVESSVFDSGLPVEETLAGLTPGKVESIASDINTDFSLFVADTVRATSRPELFDLSLLDRRLSGAAVASLVLGGKDFMVEQETIGKSDYAIGYRPVIDSTGQVAAVIAVPTLFRRERVEEENTRRNALLFGVYAVVLVGILLLAATLTNRIAAPIQQLTAATRRVAAGDLSPPPVLANADREVRELVDAFGAMTRDLARSRDEMVRYERELAWKEMAKQVAHEIKNPLTPMRLSVQHLRQAYRDGAANFGELLDTVGRTLLEQIDALSRIASEFSHFARLPRRKLELCEIPAILKESSHLFEQERTVQFRFDCAADLPAVEGDHEELRRAFINVIRNGIQAMEGKGTIEIGAHRRASTIEVTIRDHGRGIAAEARERLFEPNFSTKTDGMGLGLAIVRKTVEDLGGTITLGDAPGGGTVATILLPVPGAEE